MVKREHAAYMLQTSELMNAPTDNRKAHASASGRWTSIPLSPEDSMSLLIKFPVIVHVAGKVIWSITNI